MYKLVVAGAGTGAVNVVSQIIKSGKIRPSEIAVIDPSSHHYYQPSYGLIGGGLFGDNEKVRAQMSSFVRDQKTMFHPHVNFINKFVTKFMPDSNKIQAEDKEIEYENLVVAMGIVMDYGRTPGLIEALEDENSSVCTVYELKYAMKTNRLIREFQGGKAVFTEPTQPIKCAGAPQKVIYMADGH